MVYIVRSLFGGLNVFRASGHELHCLRPREEHPHDVREKRENRVSNFREDDLALAFFLVTKLLALVISSS